MQSDERYYHHCSDFLDEIMKNCNDSDCLFKFMDIAIFSHAFHAAKNLLDVQTGRSNWSFFK
jgi:hypothetical protein